MMQMNLFTNRLTDLENELKAIVKYSNYVDII